MLCGAAALLSVAIGGCDKEQDREPAKEKNADSKGADRDAKGDGKKTEKPKPTTPKSDEALPSRR